MTEANQTTGFERKQSLFSEIGVDLNNPVDRAGEGLAVILENLRPEGDNSLSPRPGQGTGSPLIAAQTPVHSLRRLNDSSSGSTASIIVAGAGTHVGTLDTGLAVATDRDSGYSGDPLSIAIHQPTEAVQPWAYIFDRSKQSKINSAGTVKPIGYPPPAAAPVRVAIDQPRYKIIRETLAGVGAWANAGTAAAVSEVIRVDPASRTIGAILWDSGNTGWACIKPASSAAGVHPMNNIGELMRLQINAGGGTAEFVTVEQVCRGSAATTIAAIQFEGAAAVSFCAIHCTTAFEDIEVNSMVLLDNGAGTTEYVRVLSTHRTIDGYTSFRCATVNLGAYSAGTSVTLVPSFRAYCVNTHAAAETLGAKVLQTVVTKGTGTQTLAGAIDLSLIASGLPTRPDDKMHISLYANTPNNISEIKIYLDIDGTTANQDFKHNYFFHSIRPSDLTPVTVGSQTALENRQHRYQRGLLDNVAPAPFNHVISSYVDDPRFGESPTGTPIFGAPPPTDSTLPQDPLIPPPDRGRQSSSGQSQYSEVIFPIAELLALEIGRVGTDDSRGLADVASIRVEVIAADNVTVQFDGWWIGGGYGPDVAAAQQGYIYRYRSRDSSTGAVSDFSPAVFGGVRPRRQRVTVPLVQQTGAGIDKLDVERYGGALLGWQYAGTTDNTATPTFVDNFDDATLAVRTALSEGNVHAQLWPIVQPPLTAYTCSVAGPIVTLTTGTVPIDLKPGTAIEISKRTYIIHSIITTTKLMLTESAGSGSGLNWSIPRPVRMAQNLPIVSAEPFQGFYFACGDPLNPWRLYYTNGNDPDSTREDHYIDIGAEILQNILVFGAGDRCVVWSTERAFAIEPAFSLAGSGGGLFIYRPIPNAPGMPFRWAVTATDNGAAWLTREGIYETDGGATRVLTEELRKLFPHERIGGVAVNGFYPPNFATTESNMRLSFVDRELLFTYVDTNSAFRTLVRREIRGTPVTRLAPIRSGWRPYTYAAAPMLFYAEEGRGVSTALMGGVDGKVYRLGRTSADAGGAAIVGKIRTRSEDDGDGMTQKYIGDIVLDYDTDGATINVTTGVDNHGTTYGPTALTDAAGRRQKRIDLNSGQGVRGRNLSLEITMSVTTQRPTLFMWQRAWQGRPETTLLRAGDYNMVGGMGAKFVRGIYIYADTYALDRSVTLEYTKDDGSVAQLVIPSVNHDVLCERYYSIANGIYMIATRCRPTDINSWDFVGYRLDGEEAPPSGKQPQPWKSFGGARYIQGVKFEIDTENAPIDMQIQLDENVLQTTINAAANGGPVLANGHAVKAYSFDVPFITHLIRAVPSANCRIWDVKWVEEPEPELAQMWWAQQTDCGAPGFKFFGDGYLTCRSSDELVLEFQIDDGTYVQAVFYDPSTNSGLARKTYRFRFPVIKTKAIRPRVYTQTAAGRVALFKKDFAIEMKPWGFEGTWQQINPLGDLHFESGARI